MSSRCPKVVFDCNIFLQYLLAPAGPAGMCVGQVLERRVELQLSPAVLIEIRELPEKPIGQKVGLTAELIERFIKSLMGVSAYIEDVPEQYRHPVDPDDSCYVNLAIATGARIVVSRDRHLLNLNDPAISWTGDFRSRFPHIKVLTAEQFLAETRKNP